MNLDSKRMEYVDIARGIGILLVIAGHLNEPIGLWAYSFHVPLFFFLSGYLFKKEIKFGIFIKKKVKSLLFPYFGLGGIDLCFDITWKFFINKVSYNELIKIVIRFLIQKRLYTVWFITVLFFTNLLFWVLTKIKNEKIRAICIVSLTGLGLLYYRAGGGALPWNIDICLIALFFFYVGYIIRQKMIIEILRKSKYKILLIIFALIINTALSELSKYLSGETFDMWGNLYGVPILSFSAALFGILLTIMVSLIIKCRIIEYIGKNSLVFFAFHQTIMIPLIYNFYDILGVFQKPSVICDELAKIIAIIVILIILSVINELICRSKYLCWMVGKNS